MSDNSAESFRDRIASAAPFAGLRVTVESSAVQKRKRIDHYQVLAQFERDADEGAIRSFARKMTEEAAKGGVRFCDSDEWHDIDAMYEVVESQFGEPQVVWFVES